jgi:hypothetical protein
MRFPSRILSIFRVIFDFCHPPPVDRAHPNAPFAFGLNPTPSSPVRRCCQEVIACHICYCNACATYKSLIYAEIRQLSERSYGTAVPEVQKLLRAQHGNSEVGAILALNGLEGDSLANNYKGRRLWSARGAESIVGAVPTVKKLCTQTISGTGDRSALRVPELVFVDLQGFNP